MPNSKVREREDQKYKNKLQKVMNALGLTGMTEETGETGWAKKTEEDQRRLISLRSAEN